MARHEYRGGDPVEEILRIAMRNHSGAEVSMRQRLLASAAELGLSDDEVARAEQEWLTQKKKSEELDAYREETVRNFYSHFGTYIVVNAVLVAINLYSNGHIGWAIWSILGWGIGLASHFIGTIAQLRNPGGRDFDRWRNRVNHDSNTDPSRLGVGANLELPRSDLDPLVDRNHTQAQG